MHCWIMLQILYHNATYIDKDITMHSILCMLTASPTQPQGVYWPGYELDTSSFT